MNRELALLLEPTRGHPTRTVPQVLIEASSRCRVDGELVATTLELDHAVRELEIAQQRARHEETLRHDRATLQANEEDCRRMVEQEAAQALELWQCKADKAHKVAKQAEYYRLLAEGTTSRALTMQHHDKMLQKLDEEVFRLDRERIGREWKMRETIRRAAEQEQRARYEAERQAAVLEDTPFACNLFDVRSVHPMQY
jgi:hypothetical protein